MFFGDDDNDHSWLFVGMTMAITGGLITRRRRRSRQPAIRTTELKSQHFCVTGSTSGIGKAVVKELVRRGAGSVVLAVRDKQMGTKLVQELRETYNIKTEDELCIIGLDLLNIESCRAFKVAASEGGPLAKTTCLINNAGAMFPNYHVNVKNGVEDTMMTNFLAPLHHSVFAANSQR